LGIQPITEKIRLIDTMALGQKGTVAVYLLRGSKTALVDCGYASSYRTVLQELKNLGVTPSQIDYLIPTHVHLDHGGATGHLLKYMPKAQVIAHEKAVPHLIDPSRLMQSATAVFGEEIIRAYGSPLPINKDRITAIGNEMPIDLGGGLSLTAVHTPGHAPHQISLVVEEEKILISADAIGIVYPTVATLIPTTPPPSFDPKQLSLTIDGLAQMDSKSLLAPHFGLRIDVAGVLEVTKRKTNTWLLKVTRLRNRGLILDEIVQEMVSDVSTEAGITPEELPSYARISIRTSVMGVLDYAEKNLA
jgi:glyoxylase-like metal-dependent hydrolase (beta-lactamase superfamily II)